MDVRCEKCDTVYEFESDRIRPQGVAVKCTTCGHIFKVFPPVDPAVADTMLPPTTPPPATSPAPEARGSAGSGPPVAAAPGTQAPDHAASDRAPDRRWLIRKPSGEVFRFKELTTLQQWIVQEKVSREDEISRTGRVWERLGAIRELEPFFDVVDKAREARRLAESTAAQPGSPAVTAPSTPVPASGQLAAPSAPDSPHGGPAEAAPEHPEPEDLSTPYTMGTPPAEAAPEPAAEPSALAVDASDAPPEPQWGADFAAAAGPESQAEGADFDHAVRRSASGKLLLAAVAGVLVALGAGLLALNWDRVAGLFSRRPSAARGADYKAQTLLRMDTPQSYQQALVQLDRLLAAKDVPTSQRARALAIKAEVYAAWAQSLREQAADLLAPPGSVGLPGAPAPKPPRPAGPPPEAPSRPGAPPRGLTPRPRARSHPAARRRSAARRARRGRRSVPARSAAAPATRPRPTAAPRPSPAWTPTPELRAQAKSLLHEAQQKAAQSLTLAKQAIALADTALTREALAEASRVVGRPAAEVRALLRRAAEKDPDRPRLAYLRGMLAVTAGELDVAQKHLARAVDLARSRWGKPYYRAIVDLARVYARQGQPRSAITTLRGVLAENAAHEAARSLLARLQRAASRPRPEPARPMDRPEARPALADAGAGSGKPRPEGRPGDGAEALDYDALVRRAERYSFSGNQARALTLYQRALAKRPTGVEALTGVGYAYLDQGRTGSAISYFRKALAVSPAYGEALIGLAEAYNRAGSARQALRFYKRYLRHHPAGRRSVLAKQNIRELEEKLGTSAPGPRPTPDAGAPAPRPTTTPQTRPEPESPRVRVVVAPSAARTEPRPPAMRPRVRVVPPPDMRPRVRVVPPPDMRPRVRVVPPPDMRPRVRTAPRAPRSAP